MAWFFSESVTSPVHVITGEDAQHITKSLRMKIGEELTVCDKDKVQYDCIIEAIDPGAVEVRVKDSYPCKNEPDRKITLFQALTKGDKMDLIIQKAVELGAGEIVPILTARCISRPDEKSMRKKIERWNKIALQAAMQSRRGMIPTVRSVMTFSQAAAIAGSNAIICYEMGGEPLGNLIKDDNSEISLFIGSEGGFEESEAALLIENGGRAATLGNRILRAETAPLAALSVIMYLTGNLGNENDPGRSDNGGEIKGGNWHY